MLNKIQKHQVTVTPLIQKACDMVHRDQFSESLTTLGLGEITAKSADGATASGANSGPTKATASTKYAQVRYITKSILQ